MALRVVTPQREPTPESPAAVRARSRAQTTAAIARGGQLIAGGDTKAWREHFRSAAKVTDEHERYELRSALLASVLGAQGLDSQALARLFVAAAAELTAVLEQDPREPVLLNTAGVLYYELGATKGAEALFRGAQRLDPSLPDVAGNIRACKQRRKHGGGPLAGLPADVLRELRALGSRGERVGRRARGAEGQTLSLCMIVKDEEEMLPRCLGAVAEFVDELIVVDTGSTDRTVEIAESFGATVLHHEWTGDFAEARNVGFDAASCDWKMFLDADEVLVEGEGPKLRELLGRTWREGIYLLETNYTGELDHGTAVEHNALRLFRNRPEYRFKDRIHEQIAYALPSLPERLEVSTVRIDHFGYLGVVREERGKSRRNLELLERQVEEGNDTAFVHFNLGSEHLAIGEHGSALERFRAAWQRLESDPAREKYPFFPSLASRFVRTLRHCGHHDEVERIGDIALTLLPGFTDVALEQASSLADAGRHEDAIARFREVLAMGDAPTTYSGARGAGTYLARQALAASLANSGRREDAVDELRACLREQPTFLAPVQPLAECLLALGHDGHAVRDEVEALLGEPSPTALFLLAVPFYERGQIETAEELLRASLDRRPSADRARLALVETLLSRSAFVEAVTEVMAISPDTPVGAMASRSALFAALCEGDDALWGKARDYAVAAGIGAADLTVFDSWRSGDPAAGTIPVAAAPLVVVMLEALARIEQFDLFERLVAVLDALDLAWRERRELLAGVFLARGFLDSAAEEWIAVVERDGPDRRAMLGLATVAEARGLAEDAAIFRNQAEGLPV